MAKVSERPRRISESLAVEVVDSFEAAERLRTSWAELHRSSGTTNPFTHPAWMLTWARCFVAERDLLILAVRQDDELVGVAPFAWGRHRRAARVLHPLGNANQAQFTEIPGVLVAPAGYRKVLGAVVGHLQSEVPGWDWLKISLDGQQGWFEPNWINRKTDGAPFYVHRTSRASVVLDLPATWEEFLRQRKKNVRESIRRSFNRLANSGAPWSVEVATEGAALVRGIGHVVALHDARSAMVDRPNHPTMFPSPDAVSFYEAAVTAMAAEGQAEVSLLRVGDRVMGGMAVLRAGPSVFCSVTGADPAAWQLGPGTVLIAELVRREIARETSSINLSSGPNQSKLRWSERLELNHDFVVVNGGLPAKLRFGAFAQASALAEMMRAAQWDAWTPSAADART